MDDYQKIINRIFETQDENGFWNILPESDKYYPDYLHYMPKYKATLWTLILLADLGHNRYDSKVKKALKEIQKQFFDTNYGIYALKKSHFPIPCLNGNMIYLDCYFNVSPSNKSLKALEFFYKHQRFDDGSYVGEKNEFCTNTSCYGKHTCYWGITKLLKGISFIPKQTRTVEINDLLDRCIQFVLLHKVCFSSHKESKFMIKHIDKLTFPNYKSDFLEILWLLKRENVKSDNLRLAIDLLKSKQLSCGNWNLERKVNNMATNVGNINQPNQFVTRRAKEVLDFYNL